MSQAANENTGTFASSESGEPVRAWRIAFKVTNLSYDFSRYDEIDINPEEYTFFEPDVFAGNNRFYDLCRKKGFYSKFHKDFVQTYFFSLFANTPFPCNVFAFVEEVIMHGRDFVHPPHRLTIDSSSIKDRKHRAKAQKKGTVNVDPDFEIYYMETPHITTAKGSDVSIFVALSSMYMRGSPRQRGESFFKHNAFCCLSDGRGMTFIKDGSFAGLVPNLPSASTLLPLILLTSRALGYKYCLRNINKLLGRQLSEKFRRSEKLMRQGRRNIRSLSFLYYSVEYFLTQSFLVSAVNHQNALAHELFREIIVRMDIPREYQSVKEQMTPLNHIINQLTSHEILKGQVSIRFAIVALGFFMVLVVVVVSVILGIEPLVRLLNNLGILPENLLK